MENALLNIDHIDMGKIIDKGMYIHDEDMYRSHGIKNNNPDGKACYEYYYRVGEFYKPKSILEIGVRFGYSLLTLIKGSGHVSFAEGWDTEEYVPESNSTAGKLIYSRVPATTEIYLNRVDSQQVHKLNDFYDLISVDGNHDEDPTYHDLSLTVGHCKVVIIDDYDFLGSVTRGVNRFIEEYSEAIEKWCYLPSFRGTIVIQFKKSAYQKKYVKK